MKKLLLIALALSLPLAQVTQADNHKKKQTNEFDVALQKGKANAAAKAHRPAPRPVQKTPQGVAPHNQRSGATTHQTNQRAGYSNRHAVEQRDVQAANRRTNPRGNRDVERNYSNHVVTQPTHRNNYHGHHRDYNRNSFAVARRNVIHEHHDHYWWRNHYRNTRFVLFGGGYYYLNGGYWYPAYGYSPQYNTYAYSEPIYSYNSLAPGQVLENVQLALRDQGYYRGSIDGLIGPQTRAALAAFQRDHGLVETAAVDEPTLVELGLA